MGLDARMDKIHCSDDLGERTRLACCSRRPSPSDSFLTVPEGQITTAKNSCFLLSVQFVRIAAEQLPPIFTDLSV